MPLRLPVLLLLALPAVLAVEEPSADAVPRKLGSSSLLPDNSVLVDVMLPRYDERRQLVGVLHAGEMTILPGSRLLGTKVALEFFDGSGGSRGRVDFKKALYDQAKGLLRASEVTRLNSERFKATGTGLVYALDRSEGFLLGPSTVSIKLPPATTMNRSTSPLRAAAVLGLSVLPLAAAPPVAPTAAELAELKHEARDMGEAVKVAGGETRAGLRADLDASAAATRQAADFLEKAELLAQNSVATPGKAPEPPALEVPHDPSMVNATMDGGLYFQPKEGVFVLLKNVVIEHPEFTVKAANDVKIFLDKPPEKKPDAKQPDGPKTDGPKADPPKTADTKKVDPAAGGLGGMEFGDVDRIIATGAVQVTQKAVNNEPGVRASGAIVRYSVKTGEIIVSGGKPWFIKGGMFLRAGATDAYVRISQDGEVYADPNGQWQAGVPLKNRGE